MKNVWQIRRPDLEKAFLSKRNISWHWKHYYMHDSCRLAYLCNCEEASHELHNIPVDLYVVWTLVRLLTVSKFKIFRFHEKLYSAILKIA